MRSCETHGTGTDNGKEYTVVNIAYWFHNWPHMKFTLRPIENTIFNYGENQYMTSIAFWAVLSLFVCLIIIVIYLIFAYIVYIWHKWTEKSVKSNEDKEKAENPKRNLTTSEKRTGISMGWKIGILLVAVICGLSSFVGFYSVWKIYVGLGSLLNSTQDGVNWFKAIKNDLEEADLHNAFNLKGLVHNLREDIDSLGLIPSVLNKLTAVLDKIVEYLDQMNENVIKANIPLYNLSRIDVEWIQEDIESYGNLICYILVAFISIIGSISLLIVLGVFHSNLLAVFTLIAVVGIIINGFLMSLGLSASIMVSDLCVDAKPYIEYQLNEWILYQYLIECPLYDSPINSLLGKAGKFVKFIKGTFLQLAKALNTLLNVYCNTTDSIFNFGANIVSKVVSDIEIPRNMSIICPRNIKEKLSKTVFSFNSQLSSYTQLINTLKSIADCRRINKDLYDALNSICGEVNPGFVIIYFYSIFSLLCLILIVFLATFALIRSRRPDKHQNKIQKQFNKNIKNKK